MDTVKKHMVSLRADLVLTKDPARPLYYKTPPCLFCHKIALRKAFFCVLVRTKSALSKTGRLLSNAEGVGWGPFLRCCFAPPPVRNLQDHF